MVMKARTFKFLFLLGLGAVFTFNSYAQPAGFQQHGNDSGGNPSAQEATDSITVGASIRYVVQPDASNTGYNFGTMSGTLISTFAWTVDAAVGIVNGAPDTDNDITITAAAGAGSGNISVTESLGACPGTPVTIPVEVIAAPTADFDVDSVEICQVDIADYDVAVSLSTSTAGGTMRYAINMNGPSTNNIYTATINVNGNSDTFTIPAAEFDDGLGEYVITFTEISDHISRKSSVAGASPTLAEHVLTINRTPSTGPIYHVPNM